MCCIIQFWKEDSSLPSSAVEQDRFCFCSAQLPGAGSLHDGEHSWHCCSSFPLQANHGIKHFFLGRAAFLLWRQQSREEPSRQEFPAGWWHPGRAGLCAGHSQRQPPASGQAEGQRGEVVSAVPMERFAAAGVSRLAELARRGRTRGSSRSSACRAASAGFQLGTAQGQRGPGRRRAPGAAAGRGRARRAVWRGDA